MKEEEGGGRWTCGGGRLEGVDLKAAPTLKTILLFLKLDIVSDPAQRENIHQIPRICEKYDFTTCWELVGRVICKSQLPNLE